jgi:hypothetical protein
LVERTPLPRADALREDIRDLALWQAHEIAHARFGRDAAELVKEVPLRRAEEDKKWCVAYRSAFATVLEGRKAEHWLRAIPTSMWWGGSTGRTGFNLYAFVRRAAHEVRVAHAPLNLRTLMCARASSPQCFSPASTACMWTWR